MTQTLEYLKNSFTLNIDIVKTITQHTNRNIYIQNHNFPIKTQRET